MNKILDIELKRAAQEKEKALLSIEERLKRIAVYSAKYLQRGDGELYDLNDIAFDSEIIQKEVAKIKTQNEIIERLEYIIDMQDLGK